MKKTTVLCGLAVTALLLTGLLMGAGDAAPGDLEVTKNPALLASPAVKVGELTVYGVKLGDSVEKIPGQAAVTLQPSDRPRNAVYTGQTVWYYAYDGKIYRIKVLGDLLLKDMPPYNATRMQMAFGKADEVAFPEADVTSLAYFGRHIQFKFDGAASVGEVDIYQ